jgi:type II secretory pathway pseudopilin PulG
LKPAQDDGFTLFEVLMAAVILVIGLLSLLGVVSVASKASYATRAREGATNLAREIAEDARTIPYAQISPSSIVGELQAMNGLSDVSAETGWQITRSGVTYTVTASECSIDDPKDGYGKHAAGIFCKDSGEEEGTADAQPEDLKRITVDVKWSAAGRTPNVHQVVTLTAADGSPGLSASELKLAEPVLENPKAPVVTEPAVSKLVFHVTSPTGTAAMSWSLEGNTQTPAPTLIKGTEWTFEWPITGLSDGTYQVAAQAVDTTGVAGPPISISVTLIRGKPAAPKGILGGFNTVNVSGTAKNAVELQWQANTERNVIGYRVYGNHPSRHLVCPSAEATLSLTLSCIDFNPPLPSESGAQRTYNLVALYRDAKGEVQSGLEASFTPEGGLSAPPGPQAPTELKVVKNENGSVTLSWKEPASGPAVIFYRIYRGSTDYTSRYGVTSSGTTVTFTDSEAVTSHEYWVTAVNSNLTESSVLGPKSG